MYTATDVLFSEQTAIFLGEIHNVGCQENTSFCFVFCKRRSTINLSHRLSLMMRSQSVSLKFGLGFSAYPCTFCASIRQCCKLQVFIQCKLNDCEGIMHFSNEKHLFRYLEHSKNLLEVKMVMHVFLFFEVF